MSASSSAFSATLVVGLSFCCALAATPAHSAQPPGSAATTDATTTDATTTDATTTDATTTDATTTDAQAPAPASAPAVSPRARDEAGALAPLQMGTFRVDSASPGGRRLGLGLELGWPSGATATVMLRPAHGLRVGVGAFTGLSYAEPALALRAEWLWHPFRAARSSAFDLHTHVGAGLGVVVLPLPDQRTSLPLAAWYRGPTQLWNAVRVPLGIDLALRDAPVDLTLDVVPLLLVFPGAGLGLDVALGTRLWF